MLKVSIIGASTLFVTTPKKSFRIGFKSMLTCRVMVDLLSVLQGPPNPPPKVGLLGMVPICKPQRFVTKLAQTVDSLKK